MSAMKSLRLAMLPLLACACVAGRSVAAVSEPPEIASLSANAERGNSIAQYNLGLAFAEGRNVPVNLPEAFAWLSLAVEGGSTSKPIESLLNRMTAEQLAEGRRRADTLRAALPQKRSAPSAVTKAGAPAASSSQPPATGTRADAPSGSNSIAAVTDAARALPPAGPPPSQPPEATKIDDSAQLKEQIASLLSDRQLLSAEVASLRANVTRLEAAAQGSAAATKELSQLQTQLKEAQTAATALAAKNQQFEDLAAERGRALDAANAAAAAAKDELEKQRAAHAETQSSLTRAEARVTQLSTEAARLQNAASATAAQAGESQQISADLDRTRRELAGAQEKLAALSADASAKTAAVNEASARSDALAKQIADLTQQLAAAKAASGQAAKNGAQLTQLQQDLARAENDRQQLTSQLATSRAETEKARTENTGSANELSSLRANAARLESERASTEAARAKLAADAIAQASQLATLKTQLA